MWYSKSKAAREKHINISINNWVVAVLVVVGVVELCGDSEDSVQDGCCVLHVPLLLLPLNIQIPKPVRVEVQTGCRDSILKHTDGCRETNKSMIISFQFLLTKSK